MRDVAIHRLWRTVLLIHGTVLVVSCTRESELTPRVDPVARDYFVDAPMQRTLDTRRWPSPSGRYVAHSDSIEGDTERIAVTDRQTGRDLSIVIVRQADPGSGRSHHVRWTADGSALLIDGSGALTGAESAPLCLVYRVAEADLLSAVPCTDEVMATPSSVRGVTLQPNTRCC